MKASKNLFLTALTVAALTAGGWAQTQTASNAAPAVDPAPAPPAPPAVTPADIQALKDALAAQQQQIQQLRAQLQHKNQGGQPVQTATSAAPPASAPGPQTQPSQTSEQKPLQQEPASRAQNVQSGSTDERVRNLERQIKGIGPVSLSGDVRLRGEPFFGGPADESLERARARVRVRFNATADLGEQFRTGITLASGDVNDPTTTNQTLTGFYSRKAIALDQAFVQFTPKQFKALTLVGGKFRYPWYNTELTWDKDLNPEGAAQTLAFNLDTPVLKRIGLVSFELPFAEIAGASSTDKRITQAITYGGQLQAALKLAPRVTLSAYTGYY